MPSFQYYNLTISNINPTNSGLVQGQQQYPQIAQLTAKNTIPILDKVEDYVCSIIRFSVPGFGLPLIQCLVQTPVLDINKLVYSFTLSYNDIYGDQTFWQFQPEVEPPLVNIPPEGTATQTFSNYYFLYNYQSIVNIMNVAIANALTNLKTKAGTEDISGSPNAFFYYDPNSNLIKLYTPPLFDATGDQTSILIGFNSPSAVFFSGLPYRTYNYSDVSGVDNIISIQNNETLNQQTIDSVIYNITSQEFVSLGYMSYLKNIFIGTNMNVNTEAFFLNAPSGSQNVNYGSIMTDYIPDLTTTNDAGIASKNFIYNAPALYRVFEFNGKGPLYEISAGVSFSDNLGNTYPLYLDKGQAIEIKFMFVKKNIINSFLFG